MTKSLTVSLLLITVHTEVCAISSFSITCGFISLAQYFRGSSDRK